LQYSLPIAAAFSLDPSTPRTLGPFNPPLKKGGREGDFGIPTPSGGGEKEGLDFFTTGQRATFGKNAKVTK